MTFEKVTLKSTGEQVFLTGHQHVLEGSVIPYYEVVRPFPNGESRKGHRAELLTVSARNLKIVKIKASL